MFKNVYKNKRVFVTGHTGFKGSWLCLWLQLLNATVAGYALDPPSEPNHFNLLRLNIKDIRGDIRNAEKLTREICDFQPDIVFHMAAQPLVRYSYEFPVETFETNVMGTLNLFEACRKAESIKSIVNITSDKCYENRKWFRGYRETDSMGGDDPYSCSKGCAELITAMYRKSFFSTGTADMKNQHPLVASVRAGNVIGGGDWAKDRIVPDIVRATSQGKPVIVRNSDAVRPWQHVLEPLSGYLKIGGKLLEKKVKYADAWNFGPSDNNLISVQNLVVIFQKYWPVIQYEHSDSGKNFKESNYLNLDSSKANSLLRWNPVWNCENSIRHTVEWYRSYYKENKVVTYEQLNEYIKEMETVSTSES